MARGIRAYAGILLLGLIPLACAGVFGWVWNIVKLFHADHFTGMLVARAIGVFMAPLGAILGFL